MIKKHVVELLIEANKQISNIITRMENDNFHNKNKIIDEGNNVIRRLDGVVEHLEEHS